MAASRFTYQSRNRAIVFAKPHTNLDRLHGRGREGRHRAASRP